MPFLAGLFTIVGLTLFEIISSVDNAVVNADVLSTMSKRARKWFLTYGIFFAVFLVRGLLPLLIVYISSPELGLAGAFTATFSSDPRVKEIIERSQPILLAGGGLYLVMIFLHWLFVEAKEYAFFIEEHIHKRLYFWFYATVSFVLLAIVWATVRENSLVALGAVIGSTTFFIANGFKHNAEEKEKQLVSKTMSDVSKILYLEIIDTTFSIDGVLGAFAFTLSVPLIIIGNGLGAVVVRWVTVRATKTVKKYRYLKNGAMYSIGVLGCIMLTESFQVHLSSWVSPAVTMVIVGVFFWLSVDELRKEHALKPLHRS